MTNPNNDGPDQQEEQEAERERPNYLDEWEKEKAEVLRGSSKSEKWEAAWGFESEFQQRSEEQEGWLQENEEVDWELQQQRDELKFDLESQADRQAVEKRENLTMSGDLVQRRRDREVQLRAERAQRDNDGQSQDQSR